MYRKALDFNQLVLEKTQQYNDKPHLMLEDEELLKAITETKILFKDYPEYQEYFRQYENEMKKLKES